MFNVTNNTLILDYELCIKLSFRSTVDEGKNENKQINERTKKITSKEKREKTRAINFVINLSSSFECHGNANKSCELYGCIIIVGG